MPENALVENVHARFLHLSTYAAEFYSYPWCKALAGLVWQRLFAGDCLNRNAGRRYREELLAHGNGRDPWRLLQGAISSRPSVDDLVTGALQAAVRVP